MTELWQRNTSWLLACDDGDSPVNNKIALSFLSFNSPQVSYANTNSGISPPMMNWNFSFEWKILKPELTLSYIGSGPPSSTLENLRQILKWKYWLLGKEIVVVQSGNIYLSLHGGFLLRFYMPLGCEYWINVSVLRVLTLIFNLIF